MTTAVASPPAFQSLPRLGWNGANTSGGSFSAMSTDEVSRIFMPQRKTVQRSSSSSSLASTGSSTSTVTITQSDPPSVNGDAGHPAKKKARGGFWPVSKAESTSGVSNARANGSVQPAGSMSAKNQVQPVLPSQTQPQVNGGRTLNGSAPGDATAILALLPMNGTFERKQINVPFFPDVLRVGRQTNAKTVPTPVNGFFDSKVLSRQHAEVWAERNGKIWIRDVKSSNGTFVNGQRLSPENRESEPHELRQHDTLELGIDIVSEDQKTIVHHKVSAKVEYVGLPGSSNNVLDLSFGDLDPSHGGALLSSPMSSPMVHSRSRPGGPLMNGRSSAPSSVVSSQAGSMLPQRQLNFWGAPLNVEQLVKTLAVEMRAAKQQASTLDQTGAFLNALLEHDGREVKSQSPAKESSQTRQSNGRVKPPRTDLLTRFADPPAPPPQQPLPEKPDSAKSSPVDTGSLSLKGLLKRSDTAKPNQNLSAITPTATSSNSHMLQLVEALSVAKKELDSQAARVKQLESMLKEEQSARADAEERARRLEQHSAAGPIATVEEIFESPSITDHETTPVEKDATEQQRAPPENEQELQLRLDLMVAEMQKMRTDMEKFQQRADTAESDAKQARESLAEMIDRLRRENSKEIVHHIEQEQKSSRSVGTVGASEDQKSKLHQSSKSEALQNGHIKPPRLPEHLERAITTVLRQSNHGDGQMLAQSAPYVSMLGVVLIGVGLMAYLNSFQKSDK